MYRDAKKRRIDRVAELQQSCRQLALEESNKQLGECLAELEKLRRQLAHKDEELKEANRRRIECVAQCQQTGIQLEKKDKQLEDMKEFILSTFYLIKEDLRSSGRPWFWNVLSDSWKVDQDIAFAAFRAKCVNPPPDCLDHDFFRRKIEEKENGFYWKELPMNLQDSLEFARSIGIYKDLQMIRALFRKFSALRRDPNAWMKVFECKDSFDLEDLIIIFAPREIRSDRRVMLHACCCDPWAFQCADQALRNDREFNQALLEADPLTLPLVNHNFVDLVVQTFKPFCHAADSDPDFLAHCLEPDFMNSRWIVEAWFEAGLPFPRPPRNLFPDELHDDKAIYLLIAEHSLPYHRPFTFKTASEALRGDRCFMKQVLDRDPSLFCCALESLQKDFDLAVFVFATSIDTVTEYTRESHYEGQDRFIAELVKKIRDKLSDHEAFFAGFLYGISQSPDSSCGLKLLNQGEETALVYKQHIAEYLDLPIGSDLRLLRRALDHLTAHMDDHRS